MAPPISEPEPDVSNILSEKNKGQPIGPKDTHSASAPADDTPRFPKQPVETDDVPHVRDSMANDIDEFGFARSEGAMTSGTEGASNPVYGDGVAKSTAGQAGPSMSMEKSCDQLSDVDGAFGKSADTGATPVGDELQGPECDSSADTGAKDVNEAMKKSMENGKPLPSFQDMMSFRKSMPYAPARPSAIASVNGDITRPEESSFRKAAPQKPVVRMGFRQDPRKVVEKDLEEYRIYKTQRGY